MANELRHADVGTALSKTEWESTTGHIFNSQAAGDIMYASSTSQLSRLAIGSAATLLATNSGATAPEWIAQSAITALTGLVTIGAAGATTNIVAGDVTMYNAVNDGNPSISIGSSSAERFVITPTYTSGAQLLDYVKFSTVEASSTANRGKYIFDVDGTDIVTIDDGGIDLASGKTFAINGTDIVSSPITALNSATANELVTVGSTTTELDAEANLTYSSDVLATTSSSASLPRIDITNTHAGATAGEIRFNKDSASGDDSDVMGTISWYGTDAAENTHQQLAYVDSIITDSAHGSEAASLRFYVAENDGTNTLGLQLAGQADADGEIDVTIGAGAASTTTIAGTLTMGSTAALTNAGLVAVTNQSNIAGVGTITSGVWQGTAIATAYIADNAITLAKMAHGTDGNLITYDASGAPAAVATGNDGQVLTSAGAGQPPAFENAASGGTVTLTAFEDLAEGMPVAYYNDSGTIKASSIYGFSESTETETSSYFASKNNDARTQGITYCEGIQRFVEISNFGGTSAATYGRVGVWDNTTQQITWHAFVQLISDTAGPRHVHWDETNDRVIVLGGAGSYETQGWVFTVDTTNNVFYTSGTYAAGTPVTIQGSTHPYPTSGIQGWHDTATNTSIVMMTGYQGGSTLSQRLFMGLLVVGGTNNTTLSVQSALQEVHQDTQGGSTHTVTNNQFVWYNPTSGTAYGLIYFNDGSDSEELKVRAFTHDDGTDGAAIILGSYYEPFGADSGHSTLGAGAMSTASPQTSVGCNTKTISVDTSNGNFVIAAAWYNNTASMYIPVLVALKVDASDRTITGAGAGISTPRGTDNLGVRDYKIKGADWVQVYPTVTSANYHYDDATASNTNYGYYFIINYDPDLDCHVMIASVNPRAMVSKAHGGKRFPSGQDSRGIGVSTYTLGGTDDLVITEGSNPSLIRSPYRWGADGANEFTDTIAYGTGGWALPYDTTNNIMHFMPADTSSGRMVDGVSFENSGYFCFRKPNQTTQTIANTYTDSNAEKFIGFNTAEVSAGASATITVKGGLNENQSSLTVGQEYWIGDSGKLRAVKPAATGSLYRAGLAVTASNLFVFNDRGEGQ